MKQEKYEKYKKKYWWIEWFVGPMNIHFQDSLRHRGDRPKNRMLKNWVENNLHFIDFPPVDVISGDSKSYTKTWIDSKNIRSIGYPKFESVQLYILFHTAGSDPCTFRYLIKEGERTLDEAIKHIVETDGVTIDAVVRVRWAMSTVDGKLNQDIKVRLQKAT